MGSARNTAVKKDEGFLPFVPLPFQIGMLQGVSGVSPTTIRKAYAATADSPVQGASWLRLAAAADQLGLPRPPEPAPRRARREVRRG